MEFLKYRSIDFFRYLLPGLSFIFGISILDRNETTISTTLLNFIYELDLKKVIFMIIVSYVIGFCIDPLGRFFRKKIAHKIWKVPARNDATDEYTDNDEYVLVKHYSPENYSLIETWDMLKGMAANFSVSVIFLIGIDVYKMATIDDIEYKQWIIFLIVLIIAFVCFLRQASHFEMFSVKDMKATVKTLKLKEK